jgi:hypothetical protein
MQCAIDCRAGNILYKLSVHEQAIHHSETHLPPLADIQQRQSVVRSVRFMFWSFDEEREDVTQRLVRERGDMGVGHIAFVFGAICRPLRRVL